MLPDASKALSSHYAFPVVYIAAGCGFLLIWSLDKINFSDRQLDNPALVSMAVKREGSTLCYISVRPVVLSYGSFRNNRGPAAQSVVDSAHRLVDVHTQREAGSGGAARSPQSASPSSRPSLQGRWVEEVKEQAMDAVAEPGALSDDVPVMVYPAVAVVPLAQSKDAAIASPTDGRALSPHRLPSSKETLSSPLLGGEKGGHDWDAHEHEELHHHHISIPAHALLPIFLAFVFSIHSAIEGLALGAQSVVGGSALSLLIAIASHKLIEAVSVGANFVKQQVEPHTALPVLGIYTLMTPGGILVGWALDSWLGSGDEEGKGERGGVSWGLLFQSLLQAFAAGSFLYLAVHEVSDEKCCAAVPRWLQVLLMMAGVGVMALLAVWV